MHLKHKVAALAAAFALAASGGARAVPATPPATAPGPARPAHVPHAPQEGLRASPDCDPFSDWDDDYGGSDATTHLLPRLSRRSPSAGAGLARSASRAGTAAQVIGTTPEEIHRRFLRVITANLANAGTASRVARLSDKELAAIGAGAALAAPADRAALLKLFATRLDAKALARVARAFGREPVAAAVHAYADRATRAAFDADPEGARVPPEGGGGGHSGGGAPYPPPSSPRPTLDMTLREIYLEFRTAPVGSLSVPSSLAETAMFVGRNADLVGWAVAAGTAIHFLIEEFDPAIDDVIGATIEGMIENLVLAEDDIDQGHFEAALDELFGFPVTNSSDPSGDWDISSPMLEYYMWSGLCGY